MDKETMYAIAAIVKLSKAISGNSVNGGGVGFGRLWLKEKTDTCIREIPSDILISMMVLTPLVWCQQLVDHTFHLCYNTWI